VTQAEALATKLDRLRPEDTLNQQVHLPVIRSIIERERGNAVKGRGFARSSRAIRTKRITGSLSPCARLLGCRRAHQGRRRVSRGLSVIADGPTRKCLLRWRNSVSRGPMLCKGTVRTAAKPTMISSPLGKTRPGYPDTHGNRAYRSFPDAEAADRCGGGEFSCIQLWLDGVSGYPGPRLSKW